MKNQLHLNKTACSENDSQFKSRLNNIFVNPLEKEGNNFTKKHNPLNLISAVVLACLVLFSIPTIQAQSDANTSENKFSSMTAQKQEKEVLVKGNVTEASLALTGVNIILEGTTIGTQTDFKGNFEFPKKLKKGDVLIFSFLGLTTQKVVIYYKNSDSEIELNINMVADSFTLMGDAAVKKVYKSGK